MSGSNPNWIPGYVPTAGEWNQWWSYKLDVSYVARGSITSRTAFDRAADRVNVKDFGATLDGVAFDTNAYQAARTAVGLQGVIVVPNGQQRLSVTPTGGPVGPVLWKLDGTYIGAGGAVPVRGIGTDTIENFFDGNKFFGRGTSFPAPPPIIRIDGGLNHTGGSSANNFTSLKINTVNSSGGEANIGLGAVTTESRAAGGNTVAVAGYTVRTVASSVLCYGANFYTNDQSGLPSSTGGQACGIEVDINANDLDDGSLSVGALAGQGVRTVIQAVGARSNTSGADSEIGWGFRGSSAFGDTHVTFKRVFAHTARFNKAVFSSEFATPDSASAHAIWLADGHRIALDTAGTRTLSYDSASGKLFFAVSGVNKFSIDASGNMRCAGTVTGSVTP